MSTTLEEENIKVAVRIRPIQTVERKEGDIACVKASADGKEVQVKIGPVEASSYRCNQCFPNDTTQAEFFNECGITELLDSAMKGYRACAFAFGQTGAGKTFTMVGLPKGSNNREKQSGLISRSLEYLFHKLEAAGVQFTIKLSCLEIYHEQVFDLFADEKERVPLSVREHAVEGFFIEGCKLVDCMNFPVANAALDAAVKNRQTGSHDLNSRSSRSHCLTEIHIEIPVTVGADGMIGGGVSYGDTGIPDGGLAQGEYMSRGKISLVDLAGSERLKTTKSTGKVLQEAGFINKSLYVLGKVIAGLIRTNGDLNHKDVPYRDSKLTKLLISSLGGRSRTLLISCVSEAKSNQAETLRTLKFSMSCARIRNKPMKFLDPQEKLILDLKEEIRRLRHENKKLRSNLLTAPASGEKALGRLSEDEDSSVMSRAYSAHSSLDKERMQFKPKNGGKIYGGKLHTSNSDYIKKLSPIKKKKGAQKAKREMTKEEALRMLDDMRAATMAKQHQQSGGMPVQRSFRGELAEDDAASLGSMGSSKRQSAPELEDLVRRRATGPMIFRGESGINLSPVRESALHGGYAPAQNNARNMDALRIEELEKRIARMETGVLAAQQPFPHDHHAAAQAIPTDPAGGYESGQGAQTGKRKKKKAPKPEELPPKVWKGKMTDSPYIAHLIGSAPTAQEKGPFGVRIVPGDKPDREITLPANTRPPAKETGPAAEVPPPRGAGRTSADNLRAAVAAADTNPRGKPNAKQTVEAPVSAAPKKDLHSSILDELADLGLGPVGPAAVEKKAKPVPKMTTKAVEREGATSRSRPRPAPGAKASAAGASTGPPVLEPLRDVPSTKPAKPVKKNPALPPAKKPQVLPPMQQKERENPKSASLSIVTPSKKATITDPAALRVKLETLERSLADERERMEDNPGEVTAEAEEHYEELANEARMLRKKLEMSGVDLSGQDPDDFAPTPEAVRLMARELESLNVPAKRQESEKVASSTSGHASARDGTVTPAGSADTALLFGASIAHTLERAPSKLTPLLTPAPSQSKLPQEPENDYEGDAYADDDFEQDPSKPGTAQKPPKSAPAPPIQLVREVSRMFDQPTLTVPDVDRLIKPSPPKPLAEPRVKSILVETDDEIEVTHASTSMRHSAAAAVHEALSFNFNESFEADHPSILALSKEVSQLSSEERMLPTASEKIAQSRKEAQADEYEDDNYEDDFADFEKSQRGVPESPSVAPSVKNNAAASPSSKYNSSFQAESPSAKASTTSPAVVSAPAVSERVILSAPAVSAPETAPAAAAAGEYEEDAYEEEFEQDEDRPKTVKAGSARPAPSVKAEEPAAASPSRKEFVESEKSSPYQPSYQQSSKAPPAQESAAQSQQEVSSPYQPSYQPSAKAPVMPESAKSAGAAGSPYKSAKDTSSPARSNFDNLYDDFDDAEDAPAIAPTAASSKPSASPVRDAPTAPAAAPVTASAASPAKSPQKAAKAEDDEYGDEGFDEYEVSFND